MQTQQVEYFYNKRLGEYCRLEVDGDRYISFGKPATLRQLAAIGWRKTNKARYEKAEGVS